MRKADYKEPAVASRCTVTSRLCGEASGGLVFTHFSTCKVQRCGRQLTIAAEAWRSCHAGHSVQGKLALT